MTTATPTRVVDAPRIAANEEAMYELIAGLGNAEASSYEGMRPARGDLSDHEADVAGGDYEREVVDAAIAEIAPAVVAMLEAAIAKRLPWTWERER